MAIVAVAGGSGDLGRLIVQALIKRNKHVVYVLSRRDKVRRKVHIILP